MFSNVSWCSYLTTIGILLFIWYLALILKFYYQDLKRIFSGHQKIIFPVFKMKFIKEEEVQNVSITSYSESSETVSDAEELSRRLQQFIDESVEINLSKQEFQNYLRMLFEEYPYVKLSSLRDNINKLIVSECEKHPQIILTYAEADGLWEETIL